MSTASIERDGSDGGPPDAGTIVVSLDGKVVQTVPVGDDVLTIGRLSDNTIALPHQGVSRRHAEIRQGDGRALLTDVGSAGGTLLDGVRLEPGQPVPLGPSSEIGIGPYVLTYRPRVAVHVTRPRPEPSTSPPPPSSPGPTRDPEPAPSVVGARVAFSPAAYTPSAYSPAASAAPGRVRPALLDETPPPVEARPTWPAPRAANAAPDAGSLAVRLDGVTVQTVSVGDEVVTIGRLSESVILLPHRAVAPRHAEIRHGEAGALLTDLGSAGGTLVDGARVAPGESVVLSGRSEVGVGPYTLTYTPRMASRYLQHLPAVFQDNEFLGRMLLIFESLWEPLEQRQDHFALYFDPQTCPAAVLPWLASWFALELDPHWPEARRRRLVAEAMELYRCRGTVRGITRALEVCTGVTPTIVEDPAQPYTFRISMRIPRGHDVRREVVEELVQAHKPAHVGYSLEIVP
jgi:phage tail-like protein